MVKTQEVLVDQLVRAWNSRNKKEILDLYADDYEGEESSEAGIQYGRDAVEKMIDKFFLAFPNLKLEVVDYLYDENRISMYWKAKGVHTGQILNIPPTGREVTVKGVSILRIKDGKIYRGAHIWDLAGLLRDIGLLPKLV